MDTEEKLAILDTPQKHVAELVNLELLFLYSISYKPVGKPTHFPIWFER